MTQETNTLDLYQIRNLGERFSATTAFIKQYWKVFLKNLLFIAIPYSFFMTTLLNEVISMQASILDYDMYGIEPEVSTLGIVIYSLSFLFAAIFSVLFYGMIGSLLYRFKQGNLNAATGWKDLYPNMLSFGGKYFLQSLIVGVVLVILLLICIIPMVVMDASSSGSLVILLLLYLFSISLAIALIPVLYMLPFPIFLESRSIAASIKEAFSLGFRYWGSTFVSTLIAYILVSICSYILIMPFLFYLILTSLGIGVFGMIICFVTFFVLILISSSLLIFLAYQYGSIKKREEERLNEG